MLIFGFSGEPPSRPQNRRQVQTPPLDNFDICTHFYIPPPEGYIFNIFDIFVANSFVKVSIYRKLASRNHILAGYELFMSIYNLQTRTGLNNYRNTLNLFDTHNNFSLAQHRPPALSGPEYDIHMCWRTDNRSLLPWSTMLSSLSTHTLNILISSRSSYIYKKMSRRSSSSSASSDFVRRLRVIFVLPDIDIFTTWMATSKFKV